MDGAAAQWSVTVLQHRSSGKIRAVDPEVSLSLIPSQVRSEQEEVGGAREKTLMKARSGRHHLETGRLLFLLWTVWPLQLPTILFFFFSVPGSHWRNAALDF